MSVAAIIKRREWRVRDEIVHVGKRGNEKDIAIPSSLVSHRSGSWNIWEFAGEE